jgi:SHS2 domain-containing protein
MKPYIYLAHTADAKFQAFGKSLEEAFANAAYAMTDVITDHKKVSNTIKKKIHVTSEDEKALLYDFLEQFLILLDTEKFILGKIIKITIRQKKKLSLVAEFSGDNHPEYYETKTTIKAVTYQEMRVIQEKGRVVLQVVVDI